MFESVGFFLVGILPQSPNHYLNQWGYAFLWASVLSAVYSFKRFGLLPAIGVLYFSGYAALLTTHPKYGLAATETFLGFNIVFWIGCLLTQANILHALRFFILANAVMVLTGLKPFIDNPALNGALLASSFALFYPRRVNLQATLGEAPEALRSLFEGICSILLTLSIFKTGGAIALGAFFLGFWLMHLLIENTGIAVLTAGAAIIALFFGSSEFWSDNGRFVQWDLAMNYFWANANHFFGFGTGVFSILFPKVQMAAGMKENFFIWLHNDWLQIVFETGFVGGILALVLWVKAVINLYEKGLHRICVSMIVVGACAIGQMPFRVFPFALLILYYLRVAFEKPIDGRSKVPQNASHGLS